MTLIQSPVNPNPDAWNVYGHSWFQFATGPSGNQAGRVDALLRSALDIEWGNWRNYAIGGARISGNSRAMGGWSRLHQYKVPPVGRVGPYAPDGGAHLLGWGINDLGVMDGHVVETRNAVAHTYRSCISKCRASRVYLATDAVFAYGAGFTVSSTGADGSQGVSTQNATVTTSSTITMTLPADYKGEPIALAFLLRPQTYSGGGGGTPATRGSGGGGTVTYSGTAGVTGTTYTGAGIPVAFLENSHMVRRITNLTSANASQTIIMTATSFDSGGIIAFDGGWLESKTPTPVIVVNIAKLTTAGYNNSLYANWRADAAGFGGAGTALSDGQMDADVDAMNLAIANVIAEFDGMVQIADADSAIAKDATKTSDGIHPNELGAGPIVDSIIDAKNRLRQPGTAYGKALSFNGPSNRAAGRRIPHQVNFYHCQEGLLTYGTYTPVSGNLFAVPFLITESNMTFSKIGLECTTVGTVAGGWRLAVYDDVNFSGYPQQIVNGLDPTISTAMTTATTPAAPSVREISFTLGWVSDPGLFWLVAKCDTTGTGQVFRAVATGESAVMPGRPANGISGISAMGYSLTGQGTAALPGTFPTGAALTATPPLIQVFRSK